MPLFDNYTQNILLEALYTKTKAPKKIKSGGYGVGPASLVSPGKQSFRTPWTGTTPASGTSMPSGSDIVSQGVWGNVANLADPVLNYYLDKVPLAGKDPLVKTAAKQIIKTELASRYLGGTSPTLSMLAGLGPAGAGVQALLGSTAASEALSSLVGQGLSNTVVGGLGARTNRFGDLGYKVSEKLPQLALMGIDPLDWATKAFGAQAAHSHLSNIGSQAAGAAVGAGGYLERGKRKGIF